MNTNSENIMGAIVLVASFICFSALSKNMASLEYIEDRRVDGTFSSDTYETVKHSSTNSYKFDTMHLGINGGLLDIDLAKNEVVPLCEVFTNQIPPIIVSLPKRKIPNIQSGKWRVAVMMLGNDSKWHLFYRDPVNIQYTTSKVTIKVISKSRNIIRRDMYGDEWRNMNLKSVNDYTVYRMCVLMDGKQISKYIYSENAEKMFRGMSNDVMSNDIMKDDFMIE